MNADDIPATDRRKLADRRSSTSPITGRAFEGQPGNDTSAAQELTLEAHSKPNKRRRVLKILGSALALTVAASLFPGYSLAHALTAPGNDSLVAKTAEWMRDNHMNGLLNAAEKAQTKLQPPKVGGTPDILSNTSKADEAIAKACETNGQGAAGLGGVKPLVEPALPGEGCYKIMATRNGHAAMKLAYVRPDSTHTSYVAAVAWMSKENVSFQLHPGVQEPGKGPWKTASSIPKAGSDNVIAAFNSAFRIQDSQGGYYAEGRTISPLVDGKATAMIDDSGQLQVGVWGRDFTMNPHIVSARQNLVPIVDNSKIAPNINDQSENAWGKTVGNTSFVWRSGIGQTASGDLIEVVGPSLTAETLANILLNAGAVRAMQLDINKDWTSLISYSHANGNMVGTNLVPDTVRPADRYFTTSSRDFFTVSLRDASAQAKQLTAPQVPPSKALIKDKATSTTAKPKPSTSSSTTLPSRFLPQREAHEHRNNGHNN